MLIKITSEVKHIVRAEGLTDAVGKLKLILESSNYDVRFLETVIIKVEDAPALVGREGGQDG